MYPLRTWARKIMYEYCEVYIIKVVHAKTLGNDYDTSFKCEENSLKFNIAKFIWFHLDDTPEWSDAGGTRFVRENCNNNPGMDIFCKGSYLISISNEDNNCITNEARRFWCSYKWSALRNPMVNYFRWSNYWTPKEQIHYYIIHKNTVKDSKCAHKGLSYIEPRSPKMKTVNGYFDAKNSITGSLAYETILADTSRYPCYDMTIPIFGNKYMMSLWVGWLRGTMRFESAMRFAKIKK